MSGNARASHPAHVAESSSLCPRSVPLCCLFAQADSTLHVDLKPSTLQRVLRTRRLQNCVVNNKHASHAEARRREEGQGLAAVRDSADATGSVIWRSVPVASYISITVLWEYKKFVSQI